MEMNRIYIKQFIILLLTLTSVGGAYAFDLNDIAPVNPLEKKKKNYNKELSMPIFELKRAKLTKNAIKNQYAIAMSKFTRSNVRASYADFKK